MNSVPVVLLVLSPRDWAARLHRHAADHGGLQVKARILRGEETATDGFDVLIVDDTTSFLSRRLVDDIHTRSAKVLGVYDDVDFPEGRQRLLNLGVDGVIESDTDPQEFVRRIGLMRSLDSSDIEPIVEAGTQESGRIVAVGGPFGGTGSTEVAVGLAAAFRRIGRSVVLVDSDDVSPSVAQRLGIPVVPNLRTAVDQSRNGEALDADRSLGFDVVSGIPRVGDWSELRPADVLTALRDLADRTETVIADVSSGIERLPGEGRFRLARRLIAEADTVVGVGNPTPTGVSRLLDWVAEVKAINSAAQLLVALNKVPSGGFVKSEAAREIARVFEQSGISFLPEDRRVRRASWEGSLVSRGPFARAVAELAVGIPG